MKIYVGCAIGNLQKDHWDKLYLQIEWLKSELRARGHEVLNFKSNATRSIDISSKEVFEWDREQCMKCDAMLAIGLHASTGMGMEIIMCLTKPNPAIVFATATKESNPSKMLEGCTLPGFKFEYHERFEDIPDMFENAVLSN